MNSLAELLFGSAAAPGAAISDRLATAGRRLLDLVPGVPGLSEAQMARAITGVLDQPVANVALRGWQHHRLVEEAVERTAEVPGSVEVVELLSHQITSSHHPTLEVTVDGVTVKVIELAVDIVLDVDNVGLTIAGGRVTGWTPGRVEGRATMTASGITIAESEHTLVDLTPNPGRGGA